MLRRFLRETYGSRACARLVYALVGGATGVFGFVYLFVLFATSAMLAVTFVGLPLLAAGLHGARAQGALHRWLARTLLAVPVDAPRPFDPRPNVVGRRLVQAFGGARSASGARGRRFMGWMRSTLSDATAWRAVLYLLARFPVSVIALASSVALWLTGALLISYPAWWRDATAIDASGQVHHGIVIGNYVFDTWPRMLMVVAAGVVPLVVAPWVTRALLVPDIALVRALLGPSRASQLRQRRAVAVDDAADRLRRIERDLHDGAQAHLVTLAMQLGLAREELWSSTAMRARPR